MATRRKTPILPPDDGEGVALVPIDSRGRVIEGAGSWPMPVGGDDPGALPDDDLPPEQSSADRVMALLSEISADERAVVKVFRKLPSGKQAWCNDYSPSEFEQGGMSMIRRSWGSGDFVIVLYGGTPYRIKSRSEVHIDASREPEPSPSQAGGGELAQVLRQMAEGQAQMLRAITERPDPTESMKSTLALMTMMRTAMGMDNAPPKVEKTSIGEMVDAIKELRAAGSLIGGKDEDEDKDSLLGIAKTFLPAIVQAAQAAKPAPSPVVARVPTVHVPASIANADPSLDPVQAGEHQPSTPAPETDEMGTPEMIAAIKLKTFVRALCLMAKVGTDVEEGARLVYEKIPDEAIDLLELPVWWTLFSEQFPEVADYQDWFTKVRDRVMVMLDEEGADDTVPAAP